MTDLLPVFASFIVPSASHEFKIADNESPRPQDRVFSTFNFYNNVEGDANRRLGADIGLINVYRQIIGAISHVFADLRELLALVQAGKVPPIPIETRPANEVSQALSDLKSGGKVRGRVVLRH